ncbi:alpha/beta fold hydrolase [Sphingomonas sp. MAH-20]|uniref:Alpha/beta fold hydrolase n=1 Tax=Sphingomonas horti TaxID=2682842 RepID=A0A6I4J3T5_9SPHN|nr:MULTISPECIES: alpha/beta fold hydrolase [Sphingomonas]MBA2918881.1 alpha/beta fold hydrolase [Sphingomonas sp. CGMCC 1.13658]MVO78914.1 alpha/beta fold hydrolase [Sphingomonas horti]
MSLALAMLAMQATPAAAAPSAPAATPAAKQWPTREGNFTVRDFRFRSGETLPEVRLHYTTLGSPHRNARGEIDNAVMVIHGTGGSGKQFLRPQFADELYGPGQPLDITRYYIILPDNVGHGGSSKPSDGLRMKFPHYDYDDMVELQHRLLTDGLGIRRMRLIMGTSMGCMQGFVWGEMYPDFMQALMPLACEPVQIAGLNRMWRQMIVDGIKADPAWMNGDYTTQPIQGLRTAASISLIVGGAPLNLQKLYSDRDAAIAYVRERIDADIASRDANDMIYQFESSKTYNPWPDLEKIKAPMTWINSADDFINPRNFTFPQEALKRMPNARFRLIAESDGTHGHGTHSWAKFWKQDLIELLARSAR